MSLGSLLTRKGLSTFVGVWKWKIVAVLAVVLFGYIGALHIQLRITKANLRTANALVTLGETVNATQAQTIVQLETANKDWATRAGMTAAQVEQLKKDTEHAKLEADRTRRELTSRRELDRRAPDCAALLDRSLAVCPDVGRRLRELEAAARSN